MSAEVFVVGTCDTEKDDSGDEEQKLNSFLLEIHWYCLKTEREIGLTLKNKVLILLAPIWG